MEIKAGRLVDPCSTRITKTGAWRTFVPVVDHENASSAAYVRSTAQRVAFTRKVGSSYQIWTTAKAAACALMNAHAWQLQWSWRRSDDCKYEGR